jgi:hypothetical protein
VGSAKVRPGSVQRGPGGAWLGLMISALRPSGLSAGFSESSSGLIWRG